MYSPPWLRKSHKAAQERSARAEAAHHKRRADGHRDGLEDLAEGYERMLDLLDELIELRQAEGEGREPP